MKALQSAPMPANADDVGELDGALIGGIDAISAEQISGWIAWSDGRAYRGRLQLSCAGSLFTLPQLRFYERPDLSGFDGGRGFSIDIPPVFARDELLNATLVAENGSKIAVWENCDCAPFATVKEIDTAKWAEIIDPYFIVNYLCLPENSAISILIYLLNTGRGGESVDPIIQIDADTLPQIIDWLTSSSSDGLDCPLTKNAAVLLRGYDFAKWPAPTLLKVLRRALIGNFYKVPFDYQQYLDRCDAEERQRIDAHRAQTGFDPLYCAFVHHFHTVAGRNLAERLNPLLAATIDGPQSNRLQALHSVEHAAGFAADALVKYELGLEHFFYHGQFEPYRLSQLVPRPSTEVLDHIQKLRCLDPEIPDPSTLPLKVWGRDRTAKILGGAVKMWRACAENKVVLPFFLPWFSYGGADKETLLIAKAIRKAYGNSVEIIFVLSAHGRQEEMLFVNDFDVLYLRPDSYCEEPSVDKAIERIISNRNVRCVVNSNSLDFWRFFKKSPRMVGSLTNVMTMSFCDDLNPETNARDGWLRRYFKYVAPYNAMLLSDNDRHVADFVADYHLPGLVRTRTLRYPVTPDRRKLAYGISGRPRILWASRLDHQKGVAVLASVAQRLPDCDFHIFGSHLLSKPDYSTELLRGLQNVYLRGPYRSLSEVPIEDFDLFLYTALWDGLPNILLEIGATGLPIVSSMVGGIPELLDAENAFAVAEHRSVAAFEAAIRAALESTADRQFRAERLLSKIAKEHSWSQFERSIKDIFGSYFV